MMPGMTARMILSLTFAVVLGLLAMGCEEECHEGDCHEEVDAGPTPDGG